MLYRLAAGLFIFSSLVGCAAKQSSVTGSCTSRVASTYVSNLERSYCTTVKTSYSNPVTIHGFATYDARILGAPDGTGRGLTDTSLGNAIRYAEIEVLDSSGNRIQCGETDSNGEFFLDVPEGSSALTVRVNSRSAKLDSFTTPLTNPRINASVLNCPEEDGVYSISTTVVPTGPGPVQVDLSSPINAPYTGDVLGAAFNIYDQFVEANIFIRNNVGSGNCSFIGCVEVIAAPKVKAYWYKGFNPNEYFGETEDGISFYMPSQDRLFIMGGVGGDVDSSDTDHWDNAVILHEYGHFLEDQYTITDSPGGSHSGGQIDPRLAWSEGWGNFIQAAIRNTACYTDTEGNSDSPTGDYDYIFNLPIESSTSGCADTIDPNFPFDVPSTAGEGNFREFSVARLLWDVYDPTGESGNDTINNAFAEIWASITMPTGFNDASNAFRSIGLLHEIQQDIEANQSGTDWSSLRNTLHLQSGRDNYAIPVSKDLGGCGYSMASTTGVDSTNMILRNDFYHYKHPGGSVTFRLDYQNVVAGSAEADVDLIVYNEKARLNVSTDVVSGSQGIAENDDDGSTAEVETVAANLAAGDYLVRIKVFTTGSALTYNLSADGVDLCQ